MGLTIHYKLWTHRRLTLAGVKKITASLRCKAVALDFAEVGELIKAEPDYPLAYYIPPGCRTARDVLPPLAGWVFHATPGAGAESVQLGLCRYAGVRGWRLHGFCKTQYASRHGWEHFLKSHRSVLELLRHAQSLGLQLAVEDEGGLFETGSPARLRQNLEKYDNSMAALGGALKDAGVEVEGPIFAHPEFERIEARGIAGCSHQVRRTVNLVNKFLRSAG